MPDYHVQLSRHAYHVVTLHVTADDEDGAEAEAMRLMEAGPASDSTDYQLIVDPAPGNQHWTDDEDSVWETDEVQEAG